jgi:spore maturation protein CgeB
MSLAPYADLHVLNDPTNLADFQAVAPAIYIPHCYRPALHHPGPADEDLVCDLAFVGTGYPSRMAFFEAMNLDGLDVTLAGNWMYLPATSPLLPLVGHDLDVCLDNAQAAELYRSARVGLNLYRRESSEGGSAEGWAMGPREVEMAACGLFFVRESRGEGDAVLDMLPTFVYPDEAAELVRWWLAHPEERAETALKARAAVEDRTFNNAAAAVLQLLEG